MTDLQERALEMARDHLREATTMLASGATKPEEIARTDTHSHNVYTEIAEAERWLRLVIEDPSNA